MAGIYPYFAAFAVLLLVFTEAVSVFVHTEKNPRISIQFVFFGIEFSRGGKDKKKEERSSSAALFLAFVQTLLRARDKVKLSVIGPPIDRGNSDPMKKAVRYGVTEGLLSSLRILFSAEDSQLSLCSEKSAPSEELLSARLPLYRFIYLVLYFLHRYHKYEGRKDKWLKRK